MKLFTIQVIIILVLLSCTVNAQFTVSNVGAGITAGNFKGNSTSIFGLGAAVSVDVLPWFSDVIFIRPSFMITRKAEYFFPENRTFRYYPFIKVFAVEGVIQQYITKSIFIEESAGIIYLNDRTFSDTNVWDLGTTFSVIGGIDFRAGEDSGFTIGAGINYGVTFSGTNASYVLMKLQTQYYF
ncbi:MAG: hypothetical protein Q8T08_14220 [Ignavibacteria bacterium]|jgi:hypothetical protein|nr:hypothetical protein [Ignavibacteria bacterium]